MPKKLAPSCAESKGVSESTIWNIIVWRWLCETERPTHSLQNIDTSLMYIYIFYCIFIHIHRWTISGSAQDIFSTVAWKAFSCQAIVESASVAAVQATWRAHAVRRSLKCSCSATEMQNGSTVWQCTEMSINCFPAAMHVYMYIRCLQCKEPVAISLYILVSLLYVICLICNNMSATIWLLPEAFSDIPHYNTTTWCLWGKHTQYTHKYKKNTKRAHIFGRTVWTLLVRGNFKWVSLFCRSKNGDAFSTGCHLHSALLAYAHAHWMKSHQRS